MAAAPFMSAVGQVLTLTDPAGTVRSNKNNCLTKCHSDRVCRPTEDRHVL